MNDTTHRIHLDPDALAATVAVTGGTGPLGEALAARHLVRDDGLSILARNWRLTAGELRGELDVVALDEGAGRVVVCEVKTRRDAQRFGGAVSAVGPRKRSKVRALTGIFLREAALPFHRVRLDVVAIDLGRVPTLTHVEDAL